MGVPDNGPLLSGVTWWLTFFCGAFLALRIYAKLSRKQRLWWDDHILITSWVFLLGEAILTQVGQTLGFGKRTSDIPQENLPVIAVGISAAASISCFASTLSKISFGVTLLRLTTGALRWFVWFCIVTLFVVMLPSALSTWIQCRPMAKIWNNAIEGTCMPVHIMINYGIFNAAWCAAADFALALLPWKLIWGLQLKPREKFGVGIAMSLGVLSGVCAIVKGIYVNQLRSGDFSYDGKDVTIWTVVETATAIIAASIPILRVFFKEAVSSYGQSHGRSHRSCSKPVALSNLSSSHTTTIRSLGKGREGGWMTLDATEDGTGSRTRQMSILRDEGGLLSDDEESGGRDKIFVRDRIIQTDSFSVTVDQDRRPMSKGRQWLGAP